MELILKKEKVERMIKDYYENTYSIKSCKVNIKTNSIIDKMKSIDLFHKDNPYYTVLFQTLITGNIPDSTGDYYKYNEILDMQSVKSIIADSLANEFDVQEVKFGFIFYEDMGPDLLSVKLDNVRVEFDHYKNKVNKNVKNK